MKVKISFGKGFFPLLIFSLIILFFASCIEDNNILDNSGNRQLEFSVKTCGWNSSTDFKKNSRATPISGASFDTSNSFNVIADVNEGGNWSTEVNNETASYSTANNIWQTSATHYWPGTGSTVDFYAYYPTSVLSKITHTSGSAPVLSYTVPDNAADQIDILASSETGVVGDSYNQTPVDFKHILAAVNFQVGTNGMPSGIITGVTLNNIQYKGTYSLDGTWTPNTTDKKSFSQAVSASTDAGTVITSGIMTFMIMPQTLSEASITVTYSNGGTLTRAITGTWEAGEIYTYNLSKTIPVANFDYIGAVQSYTVPLTGTYKLEVWGAEGGSNRGLGGYSYGNIKLSQGVILYICTGGIGKVNLNGSIVSNPLSAGYNGGGYGQSGGGGATHIALTNRGVLKNYISNQNEVLIVAGGAGGTDDDSEYTSSGGTGGGLSGGTAINNGSEGGSGGTQTSGGSGIGSGSFGQGGNIGTTDDDSAGAGGGGWYGGGSSTSLTIGSGGGGSGHIGSTLISGTTGMQNGVRSGDGYARITFVSAN